MGCLSDGISQIDYQYVTDRNLLVVQLKYCWYRLGRGDTGAALKIDVNFGNYPAARETQKNRRLIKSATSFLYVYHRVFYYTYR